MMEFLYQYRHLIWLVGGLITYYLVYHLPGWKRDSRAGYWSAERDFAAWRFRNAVLALAVLVPLLVVTTAAVAFQQ